MLYCYRINRNETLSLLTEESNTLFSLRQTGPPKRVQGYNHEQEKQGGPDFTGNDYLSAVERCRSGPFL